MIAPDPNSAAGNLKVTKVRQTKNKSEFSSMQRIAIANYDSKGIRIPESNTFLTVGMI